jgi:hypothetical protein
MILPTNELTIRLGNLAQSLAGKYPSETLIDLAEAASLIERLRYELDEAKARLKEESHEAFLGRNKVGQQKELMLEAAAALNETLGRAEAAEARLEALAQAIDDLQSGPTFKDYEDGYNAAKADFIAVLQGR